MRNLGNATGAKPGARYKFPYTYTHYRSMTSGELACHLVPSPGGTRLMQDSPFWSQVDCLKCHMARIHSADGKLI